MTEEQSKAWNNGFKKGLWIGLIVGAAVVYVLVAP